MNISVHVLPLNFCGLACAQAIGSLSIPYPATGPEHGTYKWPYLIMSFKRGQTLETICGCENEPEDDTQSSAWNGVQPNRLVLPHVASWLGATLQSFHSLPLTSAMGCGKLTEDLTTSGFRKWLCRRRQSCSATHLRNWNIPDHLWLQIESFLPSLEQIRYVCSRVCAEFIYLRLM